MANWKIYSFFETMSKIEITLISAILMKKKRHFFLKNRVFLKKKDPRVLIFFERPVFRTNLLEKL